LQKIIKKLKIVDSRSVLCGPIAGLLCNNVRLKKSLGQPLHRHLRLPGTSLPHAVSSGTRLAEDAGLNG
jgi:hypothetical protein